MDIHRIQGAVSRRIDEARKVLHGGPADDEVVHSARKAIRHARAGLRLLRDAVPRTMYEHEDERLRAAGRQLSDVRDCKVQLETLAALLEKEKDARRRALLARLKDRTRKDRQALWRSVRASAS